MNQHRPGNTHHSSRGACVVCGASVFPAVSNSLPVCKSLKCRQILGQRQLMGELWFSNQCSARQAHRSRAAEKKAESEAIWREAVGASAYQEAQIPLAVIPTGSRRLIPSDPERVARYRRHVEAIVQESFNEAPDNPTTFGNEPPNADGKMTSMVGQLCTACSGSCCGGGGNGAFLISQTIDHYRTLNPGISQAQVIADYLDDLPENSVAHSCINHTNTGCSLPREKRSYMCNSYVCEGVKSWLKNHDQDPDVVGVYAVRRKQGVVQSPESDIPEDPVAETCFMFRSEP